MAKRKKVVEQPEALDTARQEVYESFQSPESSLVASAHYNVQTRQLDVTLRPQSLNDTEKTYAYAGVILQDWHDFYHSPSKGRFFGERIRRMYVGKLRA